MTKTEKTPWQTLSAVDLGDKIEKKNGMSYVSWAWAWGELKNHFPSAWFRKHEAPNGYPCFYDIQGYAFVKVTVGLDKTGDNEVTEMLPILDHRNKPIQAPNSFDVNNALQRCLAKAIAYLGLGHYIYAGEDVPQEVSNTPQQDAPSGAGGQPQQSAQGTPAGGFTPHAPTVFGIDGEPAQQTDSTKALVATFLAFIPTCKDEQTLTRFYSANKGARDYIAARDADGHKSVMSAFADAKRALMAGAQQNSETQS